MNTRRISVSVASCSGSSRGSGTLALRAPKDLELGFEQCQINVLADLGVARGEKTLANTRKTNILRP
jgi:hypothetical protein